ncbi:MAG: two-component regulator propeller domain-containing protein [Bacteroidota bacterium]
MAKRLLRPSLLLAAAFAWVLSACGAKVPTPAPVPTPTPQPASAIEERPSPYATKYNPSIRFERIGIDQGLSQSSVTAILQDSQGFLWFGTQDGLNRYDGYSFAVYRPNEDVPGSLSDRWISGMVEDSQGFLWVGTRQGGLNRFDPRTGMFAAYRHEGRDEASLSSDQVRALLIDSRATLWIGTDSGLDRFDPAAGDFKHYTSANGLSNNSITALYQDGLGALWVGTRDGLTRFDMDSVSFQVYRADPATIGTLTSNHITAIQGDNEGDLWVGTDDGLNRLDRYTSRFKHYQHDDSVPHSISGDSVSSLYLDPRGGLWVGTSEGLDFFNARYDRFVHYLHQPSNLNSLSVNSILSVYEDNSGVLWVGTYGGGLNKYNRQQDQFIYYRHDPEDPASLSGDLVSSIYADPKGMVWIGTYGDGLNHLNPFSGRFDHYRFDPDKPDGISSDEIYSVQGDSTGSIWLGTDRALDRLDPQTGKVVHYRPSSKDDMSVSGLPVYVIYQDLDGRLWFGTSRGLDQFEPDTGTFIHYTPNPLGGDNQVVALAEDDRGRLWVGTYGGGLHRFNQSGEGFISYFNDPENPSSVSNNSIFSIHQDRRDSLWIGTGGGGLDRYDPETDTFTHLREKDGLPNNVIYGILEDDAGNLWLSTNNGLSRFSPRTRQFRNFTASDGLQSNEFNLGADAISSFGDMYFGGVNGVNSFDPLRIRDSRYAPTVVLTSIMAQGKSLSAGSQPQFVQDVTLAWPHNEFEFEFASLSYGQPSRNQYAYMLEGFDNNWNYIGTRRSGRYTNLPGGSYTLLLNGSNSDGEWGAQPLRVHVTVVPPFWQTNWFRLVTVLAVVMVVAGGYAFRLRSIQRRNRRLADQVRERTYALEKRNLEMEALYQADEKILRTVSLNQVFRTLVSVAVDILKADRSLVFAWDEDENHLVPRVSDGFSESTLSLLRFERGDFIIREMLRTGEPLVLREIKAEEPHPAMWKAFADEGLQSLVLLPIKVDTHLIGIFNVGFTRPDAINEDILRLFTALVQRASLSIANMQLFEQTKDLAVMEERNRLARDLHDSAKQKAFAALAQLGTANGILTGKQTGIEPHLAEAEDLVYEVIQDLTFLIQEIYPIALQEKGLATTLREYVFEWENRNEISVNLLIRNERPLELDTEQAIYRIIQEALANVARHSHATGVGIWLVYKGDSIEVMVSDNGVGFVVDQRMRGMGLRSIRERVDSIHGSMQILSAPGQGTRIQIHAPLKKGEPRVAV